MALRRTTCGVLQHLRPRRQRAAPWWGGARCLQSTLTNLVLDKDESKGVAVMRLSRGPVNSLNQGLAEEFIGVIDTLEKDPKYNGLIITSNIPGVFCAGLDLAELYDVSREQFRHYWGIIQEWWLRLYGSSLTTIAAINGHTPGAGCMMALSSDYRVMAEGPYKIGLNEAQLGLVSPAWSYLLGAMSNAVGHREAERNLELGYLYPGKEALRVGLIDELVPEQDVLRVAHEQMEKWMKVPTYARQTTKRSMREETLDLLRSQRSNDVQVFEEMIMQKPVQKILGQYIARLHRKESKSVNTN